MEAVAGGGPQRDAALAAGSTGAQYTDVRGAHTDMRSPNDANRHSGMLVLLDTTLSHICDTTPPAPILISIGPKPPVYTRSPSHSHSPWRRTLTPAQRAAMPIVRWDSLGGRRLGTVSNTKQQESEVDIMAFPHVGSSCRAVIASCSACSMSLSLWLAAERFAHTLPHQCKAVRQAKL